MDSFVEFVRTAAEGSLDGVSNVVVAAIGVVGALILLVAVYSLITSIILGISYVKYNKRKNSIEKSGQEIARKVLDDHGLAHIKVTQNGSLLFGNSYSHHFKKVRLRRRTWMKESVSSLAMAVQKSALAILDQENDPDMRTRIRLTPIIFAGPLAFVPLVVIGILLDLMMINTGSVSFTMILSIAGLAIYIISFILSIMVLRTEKKAQTRAMEIMQEDGLATAEEIAMAKKLFKLYNIEYVNNMIVALLEIIYRVLSIIASAQKMSSTSGK